MSVIGHNGGPPLIDREYQTAAVNATWDYFRTHSGNPIIAMPTGTGKSVVIARFLQSVFRAFPQQRVMMLTHVKELIAQNFEKLMSVWKDAPAGIYSAGLGLKQHTYPITFGGIGSVWRRPELFGRIDLLLIDECHLLSPNDETMYRAFITALMLVNPYLKIIGYTATPWRLGQGRIIDPTVAPDGSLKPSLFTDIAFDITNMRDFNRLISEGYLLPLVPKRMETFINTDTLHMRGGEYIEKEVQEAVNKREVTEAALKEAMEYGQDRRKWLIFASGVDHAEDIATVLNDWGIPTGCVHSKRDDRDDVIRAFKAGKLRAVSNNNVLTTGFDEPGIDMIVCLRPTASTVLWVQMLGRGTRPVFAPGFDLNDMHERLEAIQQSGKTDCLVLDYARNGSRLGPVNDPVIPKRKGEGGGVAPVKYCEEVLPTGKACNTENHASARTCICCGAEFKFEVKIKAQAATVELVKADVPVVKVFKVEHITVAQHEKKGAPKMMRVSYYCGYQKFDEYVCLEHPPGNFARRKAMQWWRNRTSEPVPDTVKEAMDNVELLAHPTHIRVWVNKDFPEILATDFNGTAFGESDERVEQPHVDVQGTAKSTTLHKSVNSELDDDIPF